MHIWYVLNKTWFNAAYLIAIFAYVRCVSSADIVGSLFKKHFGRSFMYNKPRIVPWGTPQVSTQLSDKDSPTEHCCVSFSKYDWKHFNEFLDITWRSRLDRRMLSEERYRKLSLNRAIWYAQESVALSKAVTVEWVARKPNWCLHGIFCPGQLP